jgi:YidC/Oxa1 family membrane protein insertase
MTMDNLRVFLWVGLGLLLFINVNTWQQQFPPAAAPVASAAAPAAPMTAPGLPGAAPAVAASAAAATTAAAAVPPAATSPAVATATATVEPRLISIRTDVLDAELDLNGGDLRAVRLRQYPIHKDQPDVPIQLLNAAPEQAYLVHSGLRAADGQPAATHDRTNYTSTATAFDLANGADELVVPISWQSPEGIRIEKRYTLKRGSYQVDVEYRVTNQSAASWQAASYQQIERQHLPPEQSMFDVETYSFVGPMAYDGKRYEKLDVEDLATTPFQQQLAQGWMAGVQHHFLVAAVPPATETTNYSGTFVNGRYQLSAIGPLKEIAPGASASFTARWFVGPKLQNQLEAAAPGLDLTVDYGKLTILAQPLFWILDNLHSVLANWGWAIIICTFLIKLVFYKLSETSGRSMAQMRKMQPRMKALQERYKDDRAAQSQALMELYKKEKINPAAGCLPMLVQIPFFIAFYWVLLESVEMRQAPFALWINDLSVKDPFFVLPLLMGAAMWFQQKLNPAPPDPIQAKMMQWMPVVFTGFFAFFPAGLVLYWLTNSVLSIAQQWRINKVLKAD